MTTRPAIFKWRQTEPELILCAVRWAVLQVSRADVRKATRWSVCISSGEFEQSLDEAILSSHIRPGYSSDLTLS
jgi:hypothetical protein